MSFMRTASTFMEVAARDWPVDFFLSLVTSLQASLVLAVPGLFWPSLTLVLDFQQNEPVGHKRD